MQDTPTAKTVARTCQVAVDADLVAEAEAAGLDITAEVELALVRAIASERRAKTWLHENKAAIEASNAELDRNGPWYTPDWLQR